MNLMIDMGSFEILFIFIISLIILCPEQLKRVVVLIGKLIHKSRKLLDSAKVTINEEIVDEDFHKIKESPHQFSNESKHILKSI